MGVVACDGIEQLTSLSCGDFAIDFINISAGSWPWDYLEDNIPMKPVTEFDQHYINTTITTHQLN